MWNWICFISGEAVVREVERVREHSRVVFEPEGRRFDLSSPTSHAEVSLGKILNLSYGVESTQKHELGHYNCPPPPLSFPSPLFPPFLLSHPNRSRQTSGSAGGFFPSLTMQSDLRSFMSWFAAVQIKLRWSEVSGTQHGNRDAYKRRYNVCVVCVSAWTVSSSRSTAIYTAHCPRDFSQQSNNNVMFDLLLSLRSSRLAQPQEVDYILVGDKQRVWSGWANNCLRRFFGFSQRGWDTTITANQDSRARSYVFPQLYRLNKDFAGVMNKCRRKRRGDVRHRLHEAKRKLVFLYTSSFSLFIQTQAVNLYNILSLPPVVQLSVQYPGQWVAHLLPSCSVPHHHHQRLVSKGEKCPSYPKYPIRRSYFHGLLLSTGV